MADRYRAATFRVALFDARDDGPEHMIDLLPHGHVVERVEGTDADPWWTVRLVHRDRTLLGHMLSGDLEPLDDPSGSTELSDPLPSGRGIPPVHLKEDNPRARRDTREAGWAYPIGEPDRPARLGGTPEARKNDIIAIISWLDVEQSARYRPEANTYCNIYAHDVCYLAGVYIPRVWWSTTAISRILQGENVPVRYGRTVFELNANSLFNWMEEFAPDFGWRACADLDELQSAANQGEVGVIAARNRYPNRAGHICVAAPENGPHRAVRSQERVVEPLMSQAGRNNHQYFTSRWWTGGTFNGFGFWAHA